MESTEELPVSLSHFASTPPHVSPVSRIQKLKHTLSLSFLADGVGPFLLNYPSGYTCPASFPQFPQLY